MHEHSATFDDYTEAKLTIAERESPVFKMMLEKHQLWEIEEMLEDPEPQEDFFNPEEEYGIPYQGPI